MAHAVPAACVREMVTPAIVTVPVRIAPPLGVTCMLA